MRRRKMLYKKKKIGGKTKKSTDFKMFLAGMDFGFFLIGLLIAVLLKEPIVFIASLPPLAVAIGIIKSQIAREKGIRFYVRRRENE